ncbi:gamma-aminobutyric acid type B receptor subunit 2-like [Glandiceps talaboti]
MIWLRSRAAQQQPGDNHPSSLNSKYNFVLLRLLSTFTSDKSQTEQGEALQILYDFIYEKPQLLVLFAATNSMVTQPVCEVASFYNLVQISGTASSPGLSDKTRYPLFLRTTPTDAILVPAWEALFRHFSWKRIGIIFENVEIFSLLMKDLVVLFGKRDGYELLTVEHVESGEQPVAQLQSLQNHDARIIIALAYEEMSRQIICQAYQNDQVAPKHVWLLLGWLNKDWHLQRHEENDITCTNEEMKEALVGHISIKGSSYIDNFNDVDFYGVKPDTDDVAIYEYMKTTFGDYAGYAYDAIVTIALALNQSEEILAQMESPKYLTDFNYDDAVMAGVLKNSINAIKFVGVTGMIKLTETGDRMSEVIIEQMQDDNLVETGRYDMSNDAFTWDDKEGKRRKGFSFLLLTGNARPILLSVGISFAFGALFVKTYRIYAIFKIAMKRFKSIHVSDHRLVIGVVAMVAIDGLISICWIVTDTMSSALRQLQTRHLHFLAAYKHSYIMSPSTSLNIDTMIALKNNPNDISTSSLGSSSMPSQQSTVISRARTASRRPNRFDDDIGSSLKHLDEQLEKKLQMLAALKSE